MDNITLISVTYGKRWHLLKTVLEAARDQGVQRAFVIDNGSQDDLATLLPETFGDWASRVAMGRNSGSAMGFKTGMETAMQAGSDYIFVLDDDNIPAPGTVDKLVTALKDLRRTTDLAAVCGLRDDHGGAAAERAAAGFKPRFLDSFLNFHLLDIPSKIAWRKRGKDFTPPPLPDRIPILHGPYGGLMFHRSLIDLIGYPDGDFVLYDDDTDFTYRITKGGGKLELVRDAVIKDAEASWYAEDTKPTATSFDAWLSAGSDLRIYYAMRNRSYWESHRRTPVSPFYYLNAAAYMAILTAYAVMKRKTRRLPIAWSALSHGLKGRLGENAAFRLK